MIITVKEHPHYLAQSVWDYPMDTLLPIIRFELSLDRGPILGLPLISLVKPSARAVVLEYRLVVELDGLPLYEFSRVVD